MKGSESKEEILEYAAKLGKEVKELRYYIDKENEEKAKIDKNNRNAEEHNKNIPNLKVGSMRPGGRAGVEEDKVIEADLIPQEIQVYEKPTDYDTKIEEYNTKVQEIKEFQGVLERELGAAMDKNNVGRIIELIEVGADPNAKYDGGIGDTLLVKAVRDNNVELIDALLKSPDLDINLTNTLLKETALQRAVLNKDVALAQKLMLNGANVGIKDHMDKTAKDLIKNNPEMAQLFTLYEAVEKDFKETLEKQVVDKLIDQSKIRGADIRREVSKVAEELYDIKVSEKELAGLKLSFGEEFLTITIPALLKSMLPGTASFEEIETQMRVAVYSKIMDSPQFKALAAPAVGIVASAMMDQVGQLQGGPDISKVKESVESETGPKVLGKHTEKVLQDRGIGPSKRGGHEA